MYTYPELQYSTPPNYYLGTGSQVGIFFFHSKNLFATMNYSVIDWFSKTFVYELQCNRLYRNIYYELQRNRLGFLKHFIMNYSVIGWPVLKYIC